MQQPVTDPLPAAMQRLAEDGSHEAWAEVMYQAGPECFRVCRILLPSDDLAEDAVQEAMLYIRDHAAACRSSDAKGILAWIKRVAVSSARQLGRSRAIADKVHEQAQHKALAETARSHEPIDILAAQEQAGLLRQAINSLPDRDRQTIELRYLAELNYEEVVTALACSAGAARVRVHRCLAKLKRRAAQIGLPLSLTLLTQRLTAAGQARLAAERSNWQAGQIEQWSGIDRTSKLHDIATTPTISSVTWASAIGVTSALTIGTLAYVGLTIEPTDNHHSDKSLSATDNPLSATATAESMQQTTEPQQEQEQMQQQPGVDHKWHRQLHVDGFAIRTEGSYSKPDVFLRVQDSDDAIIYEGPAKQFDVSQVPPRVGAGITDISQKPEIKNGGKRVIFKKINRQPTAPPHTEDLHKENN